MPTVGEIARQLLAPSGPSLFKAFRQAGSVQGDERFAEIAAIFPVALAMKGARLEATSEGTGPESWRALIHAAASFKVGEGDLNSRERREVDAIMSALEDTPAKAPLASKLSGGETLWEQAAKQLGGNAAALRSRRWPDLRAKLAIRLEALVQRGEEEGRPWIPEAPQPRLFDERLFYWLLDRLNTGVGEGLYVLTGPPGEGKTSFAAHYAHWARSSAAGRRRYDLVMWAQGDDAASLDWDFRSIAYTLDRGAAPDDLLRKLPHDRWLLVVDNVRDPAHLLRFLPQRILGHVVATSDLDLTGWPISFRYSHNEREREQYLQRRASFGWQNYLSAPLIDFGPSREPEAPVSARLILAKDDVATMLGLPAETAGQVVKHIGQNRLALVLLGQWEKTFGNPAGLVARFEKALKQTKDLLKVEEDKEALRRQREKKDSDLALESFAPEFIGWDPGRPAPSKTAGPPWPGLVAAHALLDDAFCDPMTFCDTMNSSKSALELLHRLAAFAPRPIPIAAVRDNASDQRLDFLENHGLVVRHRRGAANEHFVVHPEVRRTIKLIDANWNDEAYGLLEYSIPVVAALTVRKISGSIADADLDGTHRLLVPHLIEISRSIVEIPEGLKTAPDRREGTISADRNVLLPVLAVELLARAAAIQWRARSYRAAAVTMSTLNRIISTPELGVIIRRDVSEGDEQGLRVRKLPEDALNLLDEQPWSTPARRLREAVVVLRRAGFRSGAERLYLYLDPCFRAALNPGNEKPDVLTSDRATYLCRFFFEGALCSRENEPRSTTTPSNESIGIDTNGLGPTGGRRSIAQPGTPTSPEQLLILAGFARDPADDARCNALLAVDRQDHGDLLEARILHDLSLRLRLGQVKEQTPPSDPDPAWEPSDGEYQKWYRGEFYPWARTYEELARGNFAYARGLYYAGLPVSAAAAAQVSADAWNVPAETFGDRSPGRPPGGLIHTATALSTRALVLSLCRDRRALETADAAAIYARRAMPDLVHPDLALVLIQQATVKATSEDPSGACTDAEREFRTVIGHWPRAHPLVLESRMLTAQCQLDCGNLPGALDQLLVLLDDASTGSNLAGERSPTIDRPAVRAAAWIRIGNLLLDAAPRVHAETEFDRDAERTRHATARQCVDLADRAFVAAITLYKSQDPRAWTDDPRYRSVRLLEARLGALECRLRLGGASPATASELLADARRSRDYDQHCKDTLLEGMVGVVDLDEVAEGRDPLNSGPSILELRALAKHCRAVTAAGHEVAPGIAHLQPDFWIRLCERPRPDDPLRPNPRDRAEFLLAYTAVVLRRYRDEDPSWPNLVNALSSAVGSDLSWIREAEEPADPQLALRYAIRAELPATPSGDKSSSSLAFDDSAKQAHRKARSLREADRKRVLLPLTELDRIREALAREGQQS